MKASWLNRTTPLCILFVFWVQGIYGQSHHYESILIEGDEWKYQIPTAQPSDEWTRLAFDDSAWKAGSSGLGYGDDDDGTTVPPCVSLFIRTKFTIASKGDLSRLLLDIDYDDGFVAYLNGRQIAMANMTGPTYPYNVLSQGDHEARLHRGLLPDRFEVPMVYLNEGENVLAIQVHNRTASSSDLSIIPVLSAGVKTTETLFKPVPKWFVEPEEKVLLTSSNLPIVLIETADAAPIPLEPKRQASMTIMYHEDGARNEIPSTQNADTPYYSGTIGIEVRGSSSSLLDKKQYALTTYSDAGTKENVELFHFAEENDFVLFSFAYDSSFMRDFLSYRLYERMGHYASRGQYCEVVLNGEYQGLYLFQEKLKVDDSRIDIQKMDTTDNTGDALTGGYIIKSDKIEGTDPLGWSMPNGLGWSTNFVFEYPSPTHITKAQSDYIRNYFWELADKATNNDIHEGYPALIDVASFVDFMLINELASNGDAYQFSTFFHKDRNGKLRAGPIWDMNLCYGNDIFEWGYDRSLTDVWQMADNENVGAKFWKDLFDEPTFRCQLSKRWNHLMWESKKLHKDSIYHLIDHTEALLSEALIREHRLWRSAPNHAEEISNMKRWIAERIDWMDRELALEPNCPIPSPIPLVITKIHYHPDQEEGFDESDLEFMEIRNAGTEVIDAGGYYFGGTGFVFHFKKGTLIQPSEVFILAKDTLVFEAFYQLKADGQYTRKLSNAGEELLLLDALGNLIDRVPYLDDAPWPEIADGKGPCLVLSNYLSDNSLAVHWISGSAVRFVESVPVIGQEFTVYPNPSFGRFNARSETPISSLTITDAKGLVVKHYPDLNRLFIEVDGASLASGLYTLTFVMQETTIVKKLVVGAQ